MYDVGDEVTLTALFTDLDGVAADPSAVTCAVQHEDDEPVALTPASTVVGTWTATVLPDQSGTWRYRWAGTGTVTAAEEGAFYVRRRQVATPA